MNFKKGIFSLAAAGLFAAASVAQAAVYPDFQVTPSYGGSPSSPFIADKIVGGYVESITLDATGGFTFSLLWNAGQFFKNDGVNAITGATSGLGDSAGYEMYALFKGSGTYSLNGDGVVTNFLLSPGGLLNLYLDRRTGAGNVVTTFEASGTPPPIGPDGFFQRDAGTFATDILLASGTGTFGKANLECDDGLSFNCGSFGQNTSFALTPEGKNFFTAPTPNFYNVSLESGQFNGGFTPGQTVIVNGSLDVIFARDVPEPASLALVGLGLVGLRLGRRAKASKV